MIYNVIPLDKFKKEAKRLIKKYPSLKTELAKLNQEISVNPKVGIALRNNAYKIRLSIKSKGKGKSGGARVITYALIDNLEVISLSYMISLN